MKEEPVKAEFGFETFVIKQFSYLEPESSYTDLDVEFSPSGEFSQATGIFILTMKFKAKANSENKQLGVLEVIAAELKSIFRFPNKPTFEELPDFFYRNSIAIVYPYLRSFISTLTLQANTKLLMLPILNLMALEKTLRENTVQIKES